LKQTEFGVVTIVYFEKLRKNQKIRQGLQKIIFLGRKSIMRSEGVKTLQKTVPLIKCAKIMWFSKYLIFPRNKKT